MPWTIEFAPEAVRELHQFDAQVSHRILKFLRDRVAKLDSARIIGTVLKGYRLGEFWKYRIGDYRIIGRIEDERALILVLHIGHRKEPYR